MTSTFKRPLWTALLICCGHPALAQDIPTPAELPSTDSARQVLDADPGVAAAKAMLDAARLEAGVLAKNPHEYSASFGIQQRQVRDETGSKDWEIGIERSLRLPGKAALDRKIGQAGIDEAEALHGDTLHEASRQLLKLWMDWLSASQLEALMQEQQALSEANLKAVEKRFQAGDAAKLDLQLANTDLAEVRQQIAQASTQTRIALARLQARFPGIPAAAVPLGTPQPLTETDAVWRERILAHSHELFIPQAQLARAEAMAARSHSEKRPDPTINAYFGSEANNAERVIGAGLSIPLPGSRRNLEHQKAQAEVSNARQMLLAQQRDLEADIAALLAEARGNQQSWQLAEAAASSSQDSATLMQRAYSLGEADLQELLSSRRQATGQAINAQKARAAALYNHYQILVDSHSIWDMEGSDHHAE